MSHLPAALAPRKSFDMLAPIPPRLVGQLPTTMTQYCLPANHADRSAGAKMTTPALFSGSWSSNAVWRGSVLARSTAISPWRRKRASDRDTSIFLRVQNLPTTKRLPQRSSFRSRVPSKVQASNTIDVGCFGVIPKSFPHTPWTLISPSHAPSLPVPFPFSLPPLPSPMRSSSRESTLHGTRRTVRSS